MSLRFSPEWSTARIATSRFRGWTDSRNAFGFPRTATGLTRVIPGWSQPTDFLDDSPGTTTVMRRLRQREWQRLSRFQRRSTIRPAHRRFDLEVLENRVLLASPTDYTVDLLTDSGAGSGTTGDIAYVLRQVDGNKNTSGSVIGFDPAVFGTPQTITLQDTLGLIDTGGPITIDGPGASLVTINGNNSVLDFRVASGVTATIQGLTISGGQNFDGAGVESYGNLTISDTTITDNNGGAGGGIYNSGQLMVNDCIISNNSAGLGGGILNGRSMTVSNSTINDNSATQMDNFPGGGGIDNEGNATVTDCTLAFNSAPASQGGGIFNDLSISVIDCTIANNSAFQGGGIITDGPELAIISSTIAYNTAVGLPMSRLTSSFGGGLVSTDDSTDSDGPGDVPGLVTLDNVIVARSMSTAQVPVLRPATFTWMAARLNRAARIT